MLVSSSAALAQNISASRMPMAFGTIRQTSAPKLVLQGLQQEIQSADSVKYAKMVCPNCGGQMSQIYADTAMIAETYKSVRILQCSRGNKVLLTYSLSGEAISDWINATRTAKLMNR